MYAKRGSFDRLKAELGALEWSDGFYDPAGLFAFHLEVASMESLLGIMMHEATHAYVDRYLVQPGSYLPRWLGEGFAEYVGNSEIRKGKLIPGRTAKDKFVLIPGYGAVRAKSIPRMSLADVKRKIRDGEGTEHRAADRRGPQCFLWREASALLSELLAAGALPAPCRDGVGGEAIPGLLALRGGRLSRDRGVEKGLRHRAGGDGRTLPEVCAEGILSATALARG